MSIACEIDRLQCAKNDICTAIENKGVTVGNITLDNYACCIDEIQSGVGGPTIDVLVVGGGGGGGWSGGGGGGGVVECYRYPVGVGCQYCVTIGGGGGGGYCSDGGDGCASSFGDICVKGGCGGQGARGGNSGSGCLGCAGLTTGNGGGGGGGAMGDGYGYFNSNVTIGGNGGVGYSTDISGMMVIYGGGGGGGARYYQGNGGQCSGGNGAYRVAQGGLTHGGGGGGAYERNSGGGCGGVAIIRYMCDGSMGINCATGGCVYCCGDYTIHCFTSDGTFTIIN